MSLWSDFWDWVFRRGGGKMDLAPKENYNTKDSSNTSNKKDGE